jgi:hypothetical protein
VRQLYVPLQLRGGRHSERAGGELAVAVVLDAGLKDTVGVKRAVGLKYRRAEASSDSKL